MMFDDVLKDELERIDTMTNLDIVAYVNRLGMRLEHSNCTDEERKYGLELLRMLTERVRLLKVTLKPGSHRAMCSH